MADFDLPKTYGGTTIAAVELSGMQYLQVRVWPAPDGFNYIPCTAIAALYEAVQRAPAAVSGIGVKLVHEEMPPPNC